MFLYKRQNNEAYTDFVTVEKNKKKIIVEEFPEGSYGSPSQGNFVNKKQGENNIDSPDK